MLALVHASSRYNVSDLVREAREVFPEAVAPRDFDLVEVPFPERGAPQLIHEGRPRARTRPPRRAGPRRRLGDARRALGPRAARRVAAQPRPPPRARAPRPLSGLDDRRAARRRLRGRRQLRAARRARRLRPRDLQRARRRDDRARRRLLPRRRRRRRARGRPGDAHALRGGDVVRAGDRARDLGGRSATTICWASWMGSLDDAGSSCAVRIDGDFELVHARSVPRQTPPYRGLAEVAAAEQHVFDLAGVSGTIVGFRFPDYAEGSRGRPATTCTSSPTSATAAATCSTAASARASRGSTSRATSTSSCRPGSSSTPAARRGDARGPRRGLRTRGSSGRSSPALPAGCGDTAATLATRSAARC